MSLAKKLSVAILLYAFALAFRLPGIAEPAPQPDERHWQSRSYQIVRNLKKRDFVKLTSHIGHPGVTPSLVMAFGEYVGEKINTRRGLEIGQKGYIYLLQSARITNCLVSTLVVPVVFLGVLPFLGAGVAVLAALLFALDPQFIALCRIAHLDAMLALTASLAIIFYAHAVFSGRTSLKILAGIFWGLSILTKPTAIGLLFGFIGFRVFRAYISRRQEIRGETQLFSWGDIWAVIAGHAIFAALFTRIWDHNGSLRMRLRAGGEKATAVYEFGMKYGFENKFLGIFIVALGLSVLFVWAHRSLIKNRKKLFHIVMGLTVVWMLIGSTLVFPAVVENLYRFWCWTFGLTEVSHQSYGRTWQPVANGYSSLLLRKLPTIALFGIAASVVWLIFQLIKHRKKFSFDNQTQFLIFAILVTVGWILPLSTSDKQAIRYVAPIFGCLYLLSAFGWARVIEKVITFFKSVSEASAIRATRISLMLVVLPQIIFTANWSPHFMLFHNSLSGGLSAAVESGEPLPFIGQKTAVKFLHRQALAKGRSLFIYTLGDPETLSYAYYRLFPGQRLLSFYRPQDIYDAEYLLVFSSFFKHGLNELLDEIGNPKPIAEYKFKGQSLFYIYQIPIRSLKSPGEVYSVRSLARHTGQEEIIENGFAQSSHVSPITQVFKALPGTHKAGFLVHGKFIRVTPGRYKISFTGALATPQLAADIPGDTAVAKLEFGSSCSRVLKANELSGSSLKDFELMCDRAGEKPTQIRVYWWGQVPFILSAVRAEQVNSQ